MVSEVPLYSASSHARSHIVFWVVVQGYLTYKKSHPYRRPMLRVPGGSWGGGRFLMGEATL